VKTTRSLYAALYLLAFFASLSLVNAPRVFAGNTGNLDDLLRQINALEAAATAQGLKDLGAGDMALLQAPLEMARSQAKGKQVPEVREAMMKTAQVTLDGMLKSKQQAIQKLAEDRFATRQAYYAADHLPLSGGVWNDLTQKIADLAKLLGEANALSFSTSAEQVESNFKTYYPGYAGQLPAGGPADFGQDYKKRMTEWQNYSFGTLMANNREAMDIKDNLLSLLSKLNDATDSLKAPVLGYRQLIQARNQIYIFVAQEVANTRLDVMRQIEARARFAANRQQKRTNLQAAFDQAVPAWKAQSQGKGY
jgi:P-type conjugative transfer protein TrbJ